MQTAGLRSTQPRLVHSKVLESSGSSLPHMVGGGASAGAGAGTLTQGLSRRLLSPRGTRQEKARWGNQAEAASSLQPLGFAAVILARISEGGLGLHLSIAGVSKNLQTSFKATT